MTPTAGRGLISAWTAVLTPEHPVHLHHFRREEAEVTSFASVNSEYLFLYWECFICGMRCASLEEAMYEGILAKAALDVDLRN